jgi:hypothetical protein
MAPFIPSLERIMKARALILKARKLKKDASAAFGDLTYVAQVKDLMRQANDLIKFIPLSPSTSPETKIIVEKLQQELKQVENELLHPANKN